MKERGVTYIHFFICTSSRSVGTESGGVGRLEEERGGEGEGRCLGLMVAVMSGFDNYFSPP